MSFSCFVRRTRRTLAPLLLVAACSPQLGCAIAATEGPVEQLDEDSDEPGDGRSSTAARDASPRADAGASRDAGASKPATAKRDPSAPSIPTRTGSVVDAGGAVNPLAELVGDFDIDAFFGDAGWSAPPGPAAADNPKECPPVAPDSPLGSCIGVPVYTTCNYGSHACLCDWIHWLCI